MSDDKIRDQRVPVLFTKSELERLDDWMFARRMRSRGEAIRTLVEYGYEHKAAQNPVGDKAKGEANG